ncbi:MAG TPA: YbdD/YjiX family protein [Gemmatimonadales bacterium]|nr:YbdD/YjiX family protein [Gemmatimonadales bacterium]
MHGKGRKGTLKDFLRVAVGDGRGWRRVIKRVIGAPDYDAYLEHCRSAGHAPRMTEREFVAAFFESKGAGVRCC